MKGNRKFLFFSSIFVLLILTPIATRLLHNFLLAPATKDVNEKIFIITPGQGTIQIAENLKEEGLIKNSYAFRLLVSQIGIDKKIQAGDFRLSSNMTSRQIAELLTHGALDVWVTIPEGFRIEEQAVRLEEKLKFGSEKFAFDKKEYINLAEEGHMFPDTYLIPRDATAKDVASRLGKTFDEKVSKDILGKGKENNLSNEEVIILASLIEREAKTNQERPVIAGILINRLNVGMSLQIDATVQYAKGYQSSQNTWWPTVTRDDYRQVKSKYNTYLYVGLPPGPIASPGLESIRAAAEPESTDYFFYLHDNEGKIHYGKTATEHEKNIQEFF